MFFVKPLLAIDLLNVTGLGPAMIERLVHQCAEMLTLVLGHQMSVMSLMKIASSPFARVNFKMLLFCSFGVQVERQLIFVMSLDLVQQRFLSPENKKMGISVRKNSYSKISKSK